MKKLFPMMIAVSFLLAACAGYEGHPVETVQSRDQRMSCKALDDEIAYNHLRMEELVPHTDKFGANATMVVLGDLIVPLFFLDVRNGEKTEFDGYMHRNDHLKAIRADRECPKDPLTVRDKSIGYSFSDQ
jgi:hypothetical protein